MALTEITAKEKGHNGLQFREHDLAHRLLDNLVGLELGPSSHNAFGLQGSSSVAPADDFEFYRDGQITQNGKYIQPDFVGEANALPVAADSQGYVLTSHVDEHIPDLFGSIVERVRVLQDRGYIFMIIPQRDALESDRGRSLTTYEELETAFNEGYTPDTVPEDRTKAAGGKRGHYWVFSSKTLKEILERFSDVLADNYGAALQLVEEEDPDQKVGNGFCLVYRVVKARKPITLPEAIVEAAISEGYEPGTEMVLGEGEEWTTTGSLVEELEKQEPEPVKPKTTRKKKTT